jgi:hypothetical protein
LAYELTFVTASPEKRKRVILKAVSDVDEHIKELRKVDPDMDGY